MGYSMEGSGGMGDKVTEARVDGMSHVGLRERNCALTLLHPLEGMGSRPSWDIVPVSGLLRTGTKQQTLWPSRALSISHSSSRPHHAHCGGGKRPESRGSWSVRRGRPKRIATVGVN